jgi:ketosteroid isomerase-like protein
VLNQIRDLGLGLISIRRLATDDAEPAHHDQELGPERAPDPDPPVESHVESLRAAERQLQAAQLSSDVAVLSRLLDDSLLFTGPDGRLYTKDDDLRAHAEGVQSLTKLEEEDLRLTVAGQLGVTWFLGTVEATVDGQPLQARMRYTRIWRRDDTASWRVIAAHASIVPAP